MATYIALLRAVNVGGTGKLPMAQLQALCAQAGFTRVRTYIASGNVVFETTLPRAAARAALASRLEAWAGKPMGVMLRSHAELARLLDENPFPDASPNRLVIIFMDAALAPDWRETLKGHRDEQLHAGPGALYVHYGDGMAQSKLVIPAAKAGTGRNLNTVARLAAMSAPE